MDELIRLYLYICELQDPWRPLEAVLQGGRRRLVVQPLPLGQSQRAVLRGRQLHAKDGETRHGRRRGVDELEGQLVLAEGHQHEDQTLRRLRMIVPRGRQLQRKQEAVKIKDKAAFQSNDTADRPVC